MEPAQILLITGVDCAPGVERKFNEWYNASFPKTVSKVPGVVRVDRYERVEDDEQMPRYLSIVQLENMEAVARLGESEAVRELGKLYIEEGVNYGIRVDWSIHYRHIFGTGA